MFESSGDLGFLPSKFHLKFQKSSGETSAINLIFFEEYVVSFFLNNCLLLKILLFLSFKEGVFVKARFGSLFILSISESV